MVTEIPTILIGITEVHPNPPSPVSQLLNTLFRKIKIPTTVLGIIETSSTLLDVIN